ncbi:MAG: hypothetical protein JSS79_16740 [Bacteroidetes bacterium]|nr:hypothetical protein [Bacteroidota bacterium]
MTKRLLIIFLSLTTFKAFGQRDSLKQFVILTFEMDRNKDSHGTFVYYWIAELEKYEKVDEYKEPIIYSLFLHEFYSRNQLDSCCLGKKSYPFYFFQGDNFDFPKNYSEYLSGLRKLTKDNRVLIQKINKNWKDNYRETVTVYGTAVCGQLCKCINAGDRLLRPGDMMGFPKGEFEVLKDFWTKDKRILIFKDFSQMNFVNSDYRTGK